MSRELRDSVDNTIKMADNLITWARMQMKDYHSNQEVVAINDIISDVCKLYKDVASKKGVDLSCSSRIKLNLF